MRNALSVHVSSGSNHRTLTRRIDDVRLSKQAPGGFVDASFNIVTDLADLGDLAQGDTVVLADKQTGQTTWDGFIKAPTPQTGRAGRSWSVSCVGGSAVASDQSRALVYIDSSLERWNRSQASGNAVASGTADVTDDPVDDSDPTDMGSVIKCQLTPGTPVSAGKWAGAAYNVLSPAGLEFGVLGLTTRSGITSTEYLAELYCGPSGVLFPMANANGTVPGPVTNTRSVGDHYPSGTKAVILRIRRTGGATNVTLDTVWSAFGKISVVARRMTRYGVPLTGLAAHQASTYVRADWVVEDLLGRVLTMCDPVTAVVEAGTYQIDQLAYFDGAKAATVLDDLVNLYESDMLWEIRERRDNGLLNFSLRNWPISPRYLLGSDVSFDEQGSELDLANRLLVTWTDTKGRTVTRAFGQEIPTLGIGSPVNADGTPNTAFTGRVVDAEPVTLPDGKGSLANAARLAAQILASVSGNTPPAVKATLDCRVYDRLTNLWVEPHELQPGHVARRVDTGDDLRLTNLDYADKDGVATLDLGVPSLTYDQRTSRATKVA